jgi:aromatic ring-cleaving dioxygenase
MMLKTTSPVSPPNKTTKEAAQEILIESSWGSLLESNMMKNITIPDQPDLPNDTYLLDNLFNPTEITLLLTEAEKVGFGRTDYPKNYRGCLRLMTTDVSLAKVVWERMKQHVPNFIVDPVGLTWKAVGLNERWRLAKYYPGDRFSKHFDAPYIKDQIESKFTVNIYMNGGFEGGHTRFYADDDIVCQIKPKPGRCLLFRQPPEKQILHDGEALGSGIKYLFRSDIVYEKQSEEKNNEEKSEQQTQSTRTFTLLGVDGNGNGRNPYDVHIYFTNVEEFESSMRLINQMKTEFPWMRFMNPHHSPIGPHPTPMVEADFAHAGNADKLQSVITFLELYHGKLSVLIHPHSTDGHVEDHTTHAIWIGKPIPLLV